MEVNGLTPPSEENSSTIKGLQNKISSMFSQDKGEDNRKKEESKKEKKVSIPKNPKANDIISNSSNLNYVVPAGFLLIHNDLTELIEKNGGGGSSKVNTTANVVSAVSNVASAAVDIVSMLRSPAGLDEVLNNEEVNNEIATSRDVVSLKKAYMKGYLRAYYSNLIENLGYEFDYNTEELTKSTSFGSVLNDITSGLSNVLTSAVDGIGKALNNNGGEAELNSDADIQAVRKQGYSAYLKGYYMNLVENEGFLYDFDADTMERHTSLSSVLTDIAGAMGGFIGGAVEGVMTALTNGVSNATLNSDKDVIEVRKKGYKAYLKGYYMNMLYNIGYNYDYDKDTMTHQENAVSVTSKIGDAIGGLLGGAVGSVMNMLTDTTANAALNLSGDVIEVRKKGYKAYLKAYYMNMVSNLGYAYDFEKDTLSSKTSAVSVFKAIGDSLGALYSGVVGGIANTLTDASMNTFMNIDKDVIALRKAGYMAYLKAYYGQMLGTLGYTISVDQLNRGDFTLKEDNGFWDRVKGAISDVSSTIGNAFGNVIGGTTQSITFTLEDKWMEKDEEIRSLKRGLYSSIAPSMYNAAKNKIVSTIDSLPDGLGSDMRGMAKDFIKNLLSISSKDTSINLSNTVSSTYDDKELRRLVTALSTQLDVTNSKLDDLIAKDTSVTVVGGGDNSSADASYDEMPM